MTRLSDSLRRRQPSLKGPTTPNAQRLPAITRARFGLIRFRSPLLTEYLFLPVLRCFTSRRSLHTPYIFRCGSHDMTRAGFPHSDILGSRFVCQLPEAYRRLLRPSSAPGAKASTLCTYKLDHKRSFKDARVHCAVLKQPPATARHPGAYPPSCTSPRRDQHHRAGGSTGPHGPDQGNTHQRGCSLRTQQRAKPTRTSPAAFRSLPAASCRRTRSHRLDEPASSRRSTLEHHPSHVRQGRGPGHRPHPTTGRPDARCSLERR